MLTNKLSVLLSTTTKKNKVERIELQNERETHKRKNVQESG